MNDKKNVEFKIEVDPSKGLYGLAADKVFIDERGGNRKEYICGCEIYKIPLILKIALSEMSIGGLSSENSLKIERVLGEYGYRRVGYCMECRHYRHSGCWLKGYEVAKNPSDFCSDFSRDII